MHVYKLLNTEDYTMTTPPSLSSEDVPYPTTHDRVAWRAYWQARGIPWRIEPEIDKERCEFLAERRSIAPNIKHNIYPFSGVSLTRADFHSFSISLQVTVTDLSVALLPIFV